MSRSMRISICVDDLNAKIEKGRKQSALEELERLERKVGHFIINKEFYEYLEKRIEELEKKGVGK